MSGKTHRLLYWLNDICKRIWPSLAALVLPVLVVLVAYNLSVNSLNVVKDLQHVKFDKFSEDIVDRNARDVGGRMQFGIASALLRISAIAGTVLAFTTLARRIRSRAVIWAAPLTLLVVCFGLFITMRTFDKSDVQGKILVVIRQIVDGAGQSDLGQHILQAINWNIVASLLGAACVLINFATVALRANFDDCGVAGLQGRMRALQQSTIYCALFLVFLTALNKTLVDWPQAFLAKQHREAYAYLAGAIGNYWGTFGALVLISAFIPAFVGLSLDIGKTARAQAGEDQEKVNFWKKSKNLEFDVASGVGVAVAAAAPILTAPTIDLASKLLH
jgi:hypothetical protein